jgi:Prokaryotic N-terminal methylation motif
MKSRRRGATLVELAIYMTILVLLMAAVYSFLRVGIAYVRQGEAFQTAHQQAQIAVAKFVFELENSRVECVEAGNSPVDFLIFPSPDGPQPQQRGAWTLSSANRLQWKKWVCLHLDGTSHEFRRTELVQAPLPTDNPPTLGQTGFPAWDDFDGLPFDVLARNIEAVTFGVTPPAGGNGTVTISVLARTNVNSDNNAEVELRGRVTPLNSSTY